MRSHPSFSVEGGPFNLDTGGLFEAFQQRFRGPVANPSRWRPLPHTTPAKQLPNLVLKTSSDGASTTSRGLLPSLPKAGGPCSLSLPLFRNGAAFVSTQILQCFPNSSVIEEDGHGLLKAGAVTGTAVLEVTSLELFGVNQTVITGVRVRGGPASSHGGEASPTPGS